MENSKKPERQIKILIGLPCVGKSTYIKEHAEEFKDYTIISIDMIAEERSKGTGFTMEQVHNREYDSIVKEFNIRLNNAVKEGKNILIEGMNLTSEKRSARISIAKASKQYNYMSTAIIIYPPEEQRHVARLLQRSAKEHRSGAINTINILRMEPIRDGEFDHIEYIGTPPEKALFHNYNESVNLREIIQNAKSEMAGLYR